MLVRTDSAGKFRKARGRVRSGFAAVAILSVASLGLAACSGRGSNSETTTDSPASAGREGVFQAPPIEAGASTPEGLEDSSDEWLSNILEGDPGYSDYVALLEMGNVLKELASRDSVTVFAPVDEAVQAKSRLLGRYLAPETLKSALAKHGRGVAPRIADQEGLASLLRRGIVNGELTPSQMRGGLKLESLEGDLVRLTGTGGRFEVDGVRIDSRSGILATNGILYPAAGLAGP